MKLFTVKAPLGCLSLFRRFMERIDIFKDPFYAEERQLLLLESIWNFRPKLAETTLDIRRTKEGKPYLVSARSGRKVSGIHFSISHSGGLWGCVVSDGPCGLDLQKMRPAAFEALAKRFFFPEESRYVKEAGLQGFYEIWTRREALAKYTGLGFFGMSEIRPCLVDKDGNPAAGVIWNGKMVSFKKIPVPEGYLAVWCHEEGEEE